MTRRARVKIAIERKRPTNTPEHLPMLRWIRSSRVDDDLRAIGAALALCPLFWALKIHLAWWLHSARGIDALADVPARSLPLLAAQDLVLCSGLAITYLILSVLARPMWRPARVLVARVLPALIGCMVAMFAVVSWKTQQIYGCGLEVTHLRAAMGIGVMTDSILAYVNSSTIAFSLAGIAAAIFGGAMLGAWVRKWNWLGVRWRLWAAFLGAVGLLFILDKSHMKERYTYGIEQNAVLHFVTWYEAEPKAIKTAELLREIPAPGGPRDEAFRRFTPFAPMREIAQSPGIPLRTGAIRRPKNVLIVLMESTPAVYVDREAAPNLTRLADSGLRMENHFTTICETSKAVYSLFYSDYLVNLGAMPRAVYHRPMPQPSIAKVLSDRGFSTAFIHSGYLRLGDLGYMLNGFDTVISAEDLQKEGAMGWRYGVFEEHTVAALSDWVQAHKSGPFFAVYSTIFPHHPYYCPVEDRPFDAETQLGRYRNALHYADANVGKVLTMLEREHLSEDTLVVAVADHGETVSSWPCGHGINFSMEELHVPLILSNPHLFEAGSRSILYTQHPDVAPTILGLLGVEVPADWLGRNLSAATVAARAFPVTIEQAHLSGMVDNGVVYRIDEKSSKAALLRIDGEQFVRVTDTAMDIEGAYADRLSLFSPWVRWRHFERVMQKPGTAGVVRASGQ